MSETLAEELARLVSVYNDNEAGSATEEAWNLIADFAVENVGAIVAALSSAAQPVPGVKELDWVKHPAVEAWRAETDIGLYQVWDMNGISWQCWQFSAEASTGGNSETVAQAKAAAQAHFEACIRSALIPSTSELSAKSAHISQEASGLKELRPITPLSVNKKPGWLQINELFVRHGLNEPPTRLRDELVTVLSWAQYAIALEALLPSQELHELPSIGREVAKMLVRARDWMADNIREGDAEGMAALGALALYLNDLPTTQAGECSEPVADPYAIKHALADDIVWRISNVIDMRDPAVRDPITRQVNSALAEALLPAPCATPPLPAQGTVERAEPVAWGMFSSSSGCLSTTTEEQVAKRWSAENAPGISIKALYPAASPPADSEALKALRDALEPFARIANGYDDTLDPDDRPVGPLRLELCRRARAALSSQGSRSDG